jgi:hypothetical protein
VSVKLRLSGIFDFSLTESKGKAKSTLGSPKAIRYIGMDTNSVIEGIFLAKNIWGKSGGLFSIVVEQRC